MAEQPRDDEKVPFSVPFQTEHELENLRNVLNSNHAHGDGAFTRAATEKLQRITGSSKALLTTSGTHALEMASHLLGLGPGDEVIVPSFTFSSGAAAIVATGATPVFVDIEGFSGNISSDEVARAISPRTKAISVMHYGGQPVNMSSILEIAQEKNLDVIEDNAHGLGVSTPLGTLGSIGKLGIQSFHDTKNVHCGEGGALLINDSKFLEAAEIMREKGTNRSQFFRGQVDKYTWVDWGSSYLPSEFNAAVLASQLTAFSEIQSRRTQLWNFYDENLKGWAHANDIVQMTPPGGLHAAHVYYVVMPTGELRDQALRFLNAAGITATFHYIPLHSSPAGVKYGRAVGDLKRTTDFSSRQIRLPLYTGMTDEQIARVVDTMKAFPFDAA